MILRPFDYATISLSSAETKFAPAWHVVDQVQRVSYESCWMITQPSHAALAGEIAGKLNLPGMPKLEADVVRAIALHDAGWGMPDAQAVMRSRAREEDVPRSFLQCTLGELVTSWTQSVDISETASHAGGYMVSRHFWRLAEHRLAAGHDTSAGRSQLKDFLDDEMDRQQELAAKQKRSAQELEALTDVLQFCDLLSLYICCGAQNVVEFPECCGTRVRLQVEGNNYRSDPALPTGASQFSLAALRHPATKQVSGQEIVITLA
jgi:hypothetical protein